MISVTFGGVVFLSLSVSLLLFGDVGELLLATSFSLSSSIFFYESIMLFILLALPFRLYSVSGSIDSSFSCCGKFSCLSKIDLLKSIYYWLFPLFYF